MSDSDSDDDWELDDIGGIPSTRANPRHSRSRRRRGERVPNSDSDDDTEYEKRCAPMMRTLCTVAYYVMGALGALSLGLGAGLVVIWI